MNVVVSFGSQVHQIPQIGLAHNGPVISPIVQQVTPTSALATPSQSHFGKRVVKYAMLPTTAIKNATNIAISAGHVEIKDPLRRVHCSFIRSNEQRGIPGNAHQQCDE